MELKVHFIINVISNFYIITAWLPTVLLENLTYEHVRDVDEEVEFTGCLTSTIGIFSQKLEKRFCKTLHKSEI